MENETFDVVAVGAHPDDVEIGCGGTVARLADQGYRVAIVDLTDGEPTPLSAGPEVRLAEAAEAARVLGAQRFTLDLPNRRLFDSFEARVKLATLFRRLRPSLVIGLLGKTPLASPDHWQANQIIDASLFYSRLTKWDEHFEELDVHTIPRLVYYTLSFEMNWTERVHQGLVHDISETLERKMAAIECYQTQFPPAKQYLFERVRSLAIATGSAAGFRAGELLVSPRAIGSDNLFESLQLKSERPG